MYWVYDIPTASLALLFAMVFVGFTWLGIVFIKPFLRLLLRPQAGINDLVGYILGGHSAFFGLLLGLLAVAPIKTSQTSTKPSAAKPASCVPSTGR